MLKPKVLKTISEHNLIRRGDRILAAVSGGPDSVALLFLLSELQKQLKIRLHVAHLNHLIRGRQADKDESFVKGLARSLHLKVTTKKIDVPRYAKLHKLSLEDAARRVRYDFLEKTAKTLGAAKIAVGHNRDDQVETFLMRLLRGSGAKGLRGMLRQRGRIIRPLLDCSREEILAYCRMNNLKCRFDHTNFKTKYLRNKIRHHLLPILSKYNPNIRQNLKNTAELLGEDFYFLNDLAEKQLSRLTRQKNKNEIILKRAAFNKLPPALCAHVLRRALEEVKGDLVDISRRNIRDILAQSGPKWEINLAGPLWVLGYPAAIKITRRKPLKPQRIVFEHKLKVPGQTEIPEIGRVIKANVKTLKRKNVKKDRKIAFLDMDKLKGGLKVRNWRPGDKFRPFGMQGAKKLQDFFVDNKISLSERYRVPVVEHERIGPEFIQGQKGEVVWVGGQRIDDRFKISNKTRQVVILKIS